MRKLYLKNIYQYEDKSDQILDCVYQERPPTLPEGLWICDTPKILRKNLRDS